MFWRIAVSLVLTPFIIRRLGAEAYGVWILATSFSVLGYLSILTLGIPAALVKRIAEYNAKHESAALNESVNATLLVFGLLGVVGCAGLVAFAPYVDRVFHVPVSQVPSLVALLYIVAVQTLFDFPTQAFNAIVEGLQRYDISGCIDITRATLYATSVFLLLSSGYGVVALGTLVLTLAAANGLLVLAVSRMLLPEWSVKIRPSRRAIRDIASLSLKMFILRISAVVYNQMDKAIIGVLLTTTLLTDYDIANRIHSVVLITQGLIASVTMPTSSALHALNDHERLRNLFLKGTKYSSAMSVPVALIAMVLARPMIRTWIGPDFVRATGLTQLFLVYLVFWSLCHVGQNMMIGMDRIDAVTRIGILGLVINLTVSIVATARIGVTGVVWGTLCGNAVSCVLYLLLYVRTLQLSWSQFTVQVLLPVYPLSFLCAASLAIIASVAPPTSLATVLAYGGATLAVFGILFLLTGVGSAERHQIFAMILRRPPAGLANTDEREVKVP